MKVLVSDKLAKEGLDILKAAKGIEVIDRPGLPLDELKKAIADVDGIIIRSATKVTADLIAAAKRLKAIARAGAGVDNVDLEAASRRGIIVMNTPGGNTISAAEQALAMLFALARNTPAADASMKQQVWEKKKYTGTELTAKTLGDASFTANATSSSGLTVRFSLIPNDFSFKTCMFLNQIS